VFAAFFPLRTQPLVVDDVAFVPCEDGTLFAVAWRTGRVLWKHRLGGAVMARPAYTRISLEAATPAKPPAPVAPGSANSSGAVVPPASKPARTRLRPVVIVGNDDGTVVALEAGNGRLLWRQKGNTPVGNALTATDGTAGPARVFVPLLGGLGSSGGLWCLDVRTGRTLWRVDLNAAHLPAPAFEMVPTAKPGTQGQGRVFTPGDDGAIFCLDMVNGRKIWKTFVRPVPGSPADNAVVLRGEPLLKSYSWGTRLIVGGNDGGVRCLDARNGRVLWTFDAGAAVRSRPRVLHLGGRDTETVATTGAEAMNGPLRDVILIGSDGPTIHGLDARDGSVVWRFATEGTAFATPMLHGKHLLSVTREGHVYRFPIPVDAVSEEAVSSPAGQRRAPASQRG
jgi:outer membrane protein assembly factor BamB